MTVQTTVPETMGATPGFFSSLAEHASSPEWWADGALTFIVFTVITGTLAWWFGVTRVKRQRAPFEGWVLRIQDDDHDPVNQDLFWDETQRFLESDFERWKLVKSVAAGIGTAHLTNVHKAEEVGWVKTDKAEKLILIDLGKAVQSGHISRRNKAPRTPPPEGNPL